MKYPKATGQCLDSYTYTSKNITVYTYALTGAVSYSPHLFLKPIHLIVNTYSSLSSSMSPVD